ncbi:MAG: hypothetical protein ACRD2W_03795 [Acidimicrobiales bacterium]
MASVGPTGVRGSGGRGSANLVAPAGTTGVAVDFTDSAGGAGDSIYLDDIAVSA